MTDRLRFLPLIAVALASGVACADVPPEQRAEVDYLLQKIATTPCTLERNGQRGTNAEAVAHIQRKYEYFLARIHKTEDFIDLAASRSELTGRPYLLACPGKARITGHEWLYGELAAYRKAFAPAKR